MDATSTRQLVVVLGDQFDRDSAAFDGFDPRQDVVWMAEAHPELTRVWSSLPRTAMFLSAMRHFADEQRAQGRPVVCVEPGEWALREALRAAVTTAGVAKRDLPSKPCAHCGRPCNWHRHRACDWQQIQPARFDRGARPWS